MPYPRLNNENHRWPEDYFASREKFITQAKACGADTLSHPVASLGPNGEALSVDVASLISNQDEHRIIVTSGVHGVEGFIGAVIQIQALRALADSGIPERTGIVMIHAVNPWGFAHFRRVDENNVDVNRNFIDFDNTKPLSHADYPALNPIINPCSPPTTLSAINYYLSAGKLIVKNRGINKLVKPIAEGQYDYPQGLFFGGHHKSDSRALLEALLSQYAEGTQQTTILDIHSGLGNSANTTLISNSNITSDYAQLPWLENHYKQSVISDQATDNPYNAQGSWSKWCQHGLKDKHYLYLCVEIGTVNPLTLFSALKRENQAHHWSDSASRAYVKTKKQLCDVFAPQSMRWRNDALENGLSVFDKTLSLPIPAP